MRLAAGIAAAALISYATWGRYSYVYKSPLIGNIRSDRFCGDYWGLCVPLAVQRLPMLVAAGSPILVNVPFGIVALEEDRLRNSRIHNDPNYVGYRWLHEPKATLGFSKYYVLSFNEINRMDKIVQAVNSGKASLIWETRMPPDDPACILVSYP
jgi:hypothetical protein